MNIIKKKLNRNSKDLNLKFFTSSLRSVAGLMLINIKVQMNDKDLQIWNSKEYEV